MEVSPIDRSFAEPALYACPCGELFEVQRWRWIDRTADPERHSRVRARGPFDGTCPTCQRAAEAASWWLEIDPVAHAACLILGSHDRGSVVRILQEHLDFIARRPTGVELWLLQPALEFVAPAEPEARAPYAAAQPAVAVPVELPPRASGVPQSPSTGLDVGVPLPWQGSGDGVPRSASLGASLGTLAYDGATVAVHVDLSPRALELWSGAALTVRPIHLREEAYPLLGVRVLGSLTGQTGCIDAVLDVGDSLADEVFRRLSKTFEIRLCLRCDGVVQERTVARPGLEANAVVCLESARAILRGGEYPPHGFERAVDALRRVTALERVRPSEINLDEGAYAHLLTARETLRALAHLDAVSRPPQLARLLERDGFPVAAYERVRRSVLDAALEFGLCAPKRFWRRVIDSAFAEDASRYVETLVSRRAALEAEDDLAPEERRSAWERILELCDKKGIAPPEALREACGRFRTPDPGWASRPTSVPPEWP